MTGSTGLIAFRESGLRFVGPLHGRAGAVAFGQIEIVAHSDFVAVAEHGSAGKSHHQAVREFEPPAIALHHGGETAANASLVELHIRFGTECGENCLALLLGQAAKIELIVIPQELRPLRSGRARLGGLQGFDQRTRVGGSECVKEMLIHLEIKHHLQALAGGAEVIHVHVRNYVRFRENDGIAFAPGEKFAKHAKHVVILDGPSNIGALGRNDERHRIHAESGDT